jgi:hypothetical protein
MEIKAVPFAFVVDWKLVLQVHYPIALPFHIVDLTERLYLGVKVVLNGVEQEHLYGPWLFEVEYTIGVFDTADGLLLLFLVGGLHQEIKGTSWNIGDELPNEGLAWLLPISCLQTESEVKQAGLFAGDDGVVVLI